ncbi:hypothetical protein [Phenylobacterium sp.]|uniref:hypothetical protein n=1 Tax=Phenylobacterium sp. TaxID=1871053 RepID=UPI0025D658A3|nr:hypothetical protein [Phenylobacterium sp.]
MDAAPVGVFVVTLDAFEAGKGLTVLAFVRAQEEAEAAEIAIRETLRDGFSQPKVLRMAEVIDAGAMPEDFRDAMAGALRYGSWLIAYDAP